MYNVELHYFNGRTLTASFETHKEAEDEAIMCWRGRKELPNVSHVELHARGECWQKWIITNRGGYSGKEKGRNRG